MGRTMVRPRAKMASAWRGESYSCRRGYRLHGTMLPVTIAIATVLISDYTFVVSHLISNYLVSHAPHELTNSSASKLRPAASWPSMIVQSLDKLTIDSSCERQDNCSTTKYMYIIRTSTRQMCKCASSSMGSFSRSSIGIINGL
jgi:hypothetical protein